MKADLMRAGSPDLDSVAFPDPVRSSAVRAFEADSVAMPARSPRFLIADDHRFLCEALAGVVGQHWPHSEIAQAGSFTAVLALLSQAQFDVAILDFCMPGPYGGAAVAQIRTQYPGMKIVILSGAIEPREAWEALVKGVVAYVPKSIGADGIVHVLTLVLDGETYVPRALIDAMSHVPMEAKPEPVDCPGLGLRETRLLEALIRGHPNKVIAHAMGISESTVKLYMHKLFQTLGANNRTEAVARGLERMRMRP